jgi:hypothetical protein
VVFEGEDGEQQLLVFAHQVGILEGKDDVWGFEPVGGELLVIGELDQEPPFWKVTRVPNPLVVSRSQAAASGRVETSWGAAAYHDVTEQMVYIYGVTEHGGGDKRAILARVSTKTVTDFQTWQFYTGTGWSSDDTAARPVMLGVVNEFTVDEIKGGKGFLAIQSEVIPSARIIARTAKYPWGPWSDGVEIYTVAELADDPTLFQGQAKAHLHLSAWPWVLVSYVVNSHDFWNMASDTSIYRPRFLRVNVSGLF